MPSNAKRYGWAAVMGVLVLLAIPWFLWGIDRVVFGLPVWLWWHVGWMALASLVFRLFTQQGWGVWIVDSAGETP